MRVQRATSVNSCDMDMRSPSATMMVEGTGGYFAGGRRTRRRLVPANEYQECVNKARASSAHRAGRSRAE